MSSRRNAFVVFGSAVIVVLAISFYFTTHRISEKECGFCRRPLKRELVVIAEIGGKTFEVCCARCAITQANQEKKPLRLVEVRDYPTGKALEPGEAVYVEDGHAIACDHDAMKMIDEMKQTETLAFDRCSPGTFAFSRRQDADDFVAKNGGKVLTLAQLMSEVRVK